MAYTLTYTFPEQYIDEDNYLQLIIEFTHTFATANFSYTAIEKGLKVMRYGTLKMSYDLEDAFLVPGILSLTIGDSSSVLDEDFFNNPLIEKTAKITLKKNGSNIFIGNIIEDSVEYDFGKKQLKFEAAPQIDIINKRMVYDETGTIALNPLSLTQDTYTSVITILEEIFQLVNPSISYPTSLEVIHDWEFQGKNDSGGAFINDLVFEELLQLVNPLCFDNSYGISNVGDILKKLAIDWCSFAGFISYEKAFFKKLFHYNADNLQTVSVYSWKKTFRYGLIDYVKLTTGITSPNEPYEEGTFTELEGRYLVKKTLPGFFIDGSTGSNIKASISRTGYFIFTVDGGSIGTYPVEGNTYSNNGSTFFIIGVLPTEDATAKITAYRISGTNDPSASGTLTRVSGSGDASITFSASGSANGTYQVYQTRDPNILSNAFDDHGAIMAKFWYQNRNNIASCRVDKFVFKGINYDFLKDFNYSGSKYQPIEMVFDFSKNLTNCEAIYLGEL